VPPTTDRAAYEEFLNGNVYASRPRAEESTRRAIVAYERATRADPNFALAYAKLAQTQSMYYAMNFSHPDIPSPRERARTALDRAWKLDSTLPAVRMARGFYAYWVLANNDTAMVHLAAASAADTSNTELLSVLGDVLRSQGKWNEALAATRRAADLDPRSQHYAFDVGVSAAWIGRFEEADRYLQKAIAIAPDWPTPYITRAYVHICWNGDTTRALSIMREAATRIDTTKIFVELISNYREDIAVLDAAWQDALARLQLRGLPVDSGRFYLAKAELFDRKHNAPLARVYFDSARAVFEPRNRPNAEQRVVNPLLHAELGLAYAGTGRAAQAVAEGKLALQQMPASRNETAHAYLTMALVQIYIVLEQYDAAIDLLDSEPTTKFLAPAPALRTYPFFAALRPYPRFQALIHRLE
jgi:tetratricopeptide (TPR) repeat protein